MENNQCYASGIALHIFKKRKLLVLETDATKHILVTRLWVGVKLLLRGGENMILFFFEYVSRRSNMFQISGVLLLVKQLRNYTLCLKRAAHDLPRLHYGRSCRRTLAAPGNQVCASILRKISEHCVYMYIN